MSLGLRKARVYIQKKRGTLFYAHPILRGSCKTYPPKKNDLAHAEYVYTPIHHGTHYQHTANRCTIDARRNTHPVSIRHIPVLGWKKLQDFVIPKQALTNAFYNYVFAGISPTRPPSGYHGSDTSSHPTAWLLFICL